VADTQRTIAAVMALLADNTTADISPQDLRDAIESLRPRFGRIYVLPAGSAAVVIPDTVNYVEITSPTWTLDANALDVDESDGNGKLTYTGAADVVAHVTAHLSLTSASNNQDVHFRVAKNGTTLPESEAIYKILQGADATGVALETIVALSTGDHLSLAVRNATGANNITVENAGLQILTHPAAS